MGAVWLLATAAAWGQASRSTTSPGKPATASKSTASASQPKLSDAQLEALIRAKFAKSKSANKFTVRVQGGVASIDGKTDVVQHKGAATHMAKSAGAIAVNNRVEISDDAKQKAAGNLETGRRRAQIKRGDPRSQP
jgi:UDP-N-acetylmuramate-alanine ligase